VRKKIKKLIKPGKQKKIIEKPNREKNRSQIKKSRKKTDSNREKPSQTEKI
jgi:hypothetical protein